MKVHQVAYAHLDIEPNRRSIEFFMHHPFRPHSIGVWYDRVVRGELQEPDITNVQLGHSRELCAHLEASTFRVRGQTSRECLESLLAVPSAGVTRFEHVRLKIQHRSVYLQPNLCLTFSTLSTGRCLRIDWAGALSAVLIIGSSTDLVNDPLQMHGKTIPEHVAPSVPTKHRDDIRRIPEPDVRMVDTYEEQLKEWVIGNSCHVRVGSSYECCPDFSCCYPDCRHSFEIREKFVNSDTATRHRMCSNFLSEFVGKLGQDRKAHLVT